MIVILLVRATPGHTDSSQPEPNVSLTPNPLTAAT